MNFDWQTEQEREDVWEQEPEQETEGAGGRPSRRRRWLALLVMSALLLAAGLLVRREAQRRVEEATATVEEDVVSSHALGLQAAQDGDDELFVTLLSGREPSWTETQKALLEAGLLYDQAARPLGLRPAGKPQVVNVSFSPDLRAAELQMSQRYAAEGVSGVESIALQRTLIYREGRQRWLLAPPEADFWGSWDSVTEGALTVDYPKRDEEVARRLAGDLTAMLAEMCATLDELGCTSGWWMRLRLEKNPQSLLALGEKEAGAPTGTEVSLPAPSLVGVPADDAAYGALLRGYARHLAAAAVGDLAGWECCGDGVLFYQALLHEQLAQLGLRARPAPLRDYVYLVDDWAGDEALYSAINDYWHESRPVPPGEEVPLAVHAFLAFMRSERPGSSAVALQRSLSPADAPSLLRWVDPTAPSIGTLRDQVRTGFYDFARRQMRQATEEFDLPEGATLPQQDLLLACGGNDGFGLYRYDLAAGNLSLEVDLNAGYVHMVGGAPHRTVAILAFEERDDEIVIQNLLWRPSGEIVQVVGPDVRDSERVWLPLSYGPGGEFAALVYALPLEETEPSFGLVDVESCVPGGCDLQSLPGLPLWSPSGAHLLALDVFQEEILLHQRSEGESAWQEVGRAWAPVWLDDQTYAYVPYSDQVRLGSLWAAPVDGSEPKRLVPAEDLLGAVPAGLGGRRVTISWAFPHPMDETQLLVGARSQSGGGQLLFLVERATPELPWLEASPSVTFVEHFAEAVNVDWIGGWFGAQDVFSPDGRWLFLPVGPPEASGGGIVLYDLSNREVVLQSRAEMVGGGFLGQTYDWSPDGEWLARPVAGMIDVLAPGYEVDGRPYRRLIVHDFEGCTQAVWVGDG